MKKSCRLGVKRFKAINLFPAFVFVVAVLVFASPVRAAGRQQVHIHMPAGTAHLQPLGRLTGSQQLDLAIGLPLRNREALALLLQQIYDPASPNYRHFLTPEQFTEQFGPNKQDYQAVIAFAKANGLRVTKEHPNRLLVDVSGSVADVERVLHVRIQVYQHPTEARTFYAPDVEPSLDLTVPILGISGLNNYSLPRPHYAIQQLANGRTVSPNVGSGPGGTYMGKDFRTAYVPDTSLTGSGQVVGLLQFDGYTASDITSYESLAGLPRVTLTNVLIDGASGNPSGSGGEVEVSLDIEMAISMAPGLSRVIIYEAPNPSPFVDLLNRMATDNLAKQLSCSWYIPNGPAEPMADQIWQQMAAQGQSFFNASGDNDAYTGLISFPGDSTNITQVGGTTLTTSGASGPWVAETVWNWGNGIGSGGGISTQYPIPSWQTNINMTANQGSTTMRNTPDVALTADQVYVRADGANYNVGGTSCAAPLWAGFTALVNQQAAATGEPAVGFINPAVDAIGSGPNYTACFHDITTGNNTSGSSPHKFYAVSGYDLCTGWGTPNGQTLINALANPEALQIIPTTGFSSMGGVGGPFTVTAQNFSLTNVGTNALTWSLSNTSLWLNASTSGGSLTGGGPAVNVTLSLNSVASNLLVGTYSASVWFTNLNDSVGQGRQFTLAVLSPPTITQQPTNQAVLDGAAATFTVGATGGLPLYYQWQYNSNNLSDGGSISGSTTTNLTISNVSATNIGYYNVIVSNVAGVAISSNVLLTITSSSPVITQQPSNQVAVVGTTAQFSVAAIGTKPFLYQWTFNQANITNATNATLILNNVQLTNAGTYAVMISNIIGSTTSSNANLTVYAVPIITSFSPAAGAAGSSVTISGLNFSPAAGSNTVYFGAVKATVVSASPTNLVVTVPAGATYAPITETVNGLTAYADGPFLPVFPSGGTLGSSSFVGPVNLAAAGNGPAKVVVGDLDGDGKSDVVVANVYDGSIWIYRNISTNGALTAGSFAPPVILTIGGGTDSTWGLALADLDGDGRLDIVVANRNLNMVSIFQNFSTLGNLTTNSFGARVDLPVAGTPFGVAVADVDGDGRPDIITANQSSNTVSVLRNIGTGGIITTNSFAAPINFAVGSGPAHMAIADLDGDGKSDVVTITGDNNNPISVLRNISTVGNIAFAPTVNFPGLLSSLDVAIGDLDGDGKPDLVVGSFNNGQAVSIYRNTSTPGSITTNSFAPHVDFAVGGWGNTVAIGDLDGDGKPDVVVLVQLPNHLSLFRNISSVGSITTSSFASRVDLATGNNPNGIAIGDLDGDGRPDLVFGNTYDNTVSIYLNKTPFGGPPVITTQPTNQTVAVGGTAVFSVTATGSLPLSYQWFLNQTNQLVGATNASLLLTNVQLTTAGNYTVLVSNLISSVLSSNATLTVLPLSTNVPVITSFSPAAGAAGSSETISGLNFSPLAGSNTVYFGAVKAIVVNASPTNLVVTVPVGATYAPITETVNGLTAYADSLFLPVFPSSGTLGSSSFVGPINLATAGNGPARVVIGDLDGDGKPDVVVANVYDGSIWIYRNISTNGTLTAGSFASPVIFAIGGGTDSQDGLALADLDGDGRLDIVTVNRNLNIVSIFQNFSSTGGLTTNSFGARVDIPLAGIPSGVAVMDLDGDGRPDIVTANQGSNTVSVLRNLSTGGLITSNSFAAAVNVPVGPGPWWVSLADLDGDGKPDVVTANLSSSGPGVVSVLRNKSSVGNITFAPDVDFPGLGGPLSVEVGDLDGDGKADLVVGSYGGQAVAVYQNTSTPGTINSNSFAPAVNLPANGEVTVAVIGDLDGDGRPDLAVVTHIPDHLSVFRNLMSTPGTITAASFGPRVDFTSGSLPNGVAIGDLDGDGRPDLVFGNAYGNTVSIYQNTTPFGGPPLIISQPTNKTVLVSGTAVFSVGANGSLPLSYQWFFNQTNLLPNQTNSSLVLTNVQLTNAGNYTVLVSNLISSVLSSNATLTVQTPAAITTQPTNQTVYIGGAANFGVTASGTLPLSYQWNFNQTNIVNATNATLVLTAVQLNQAGNYTVLVSNPVNSILSSNAVLTVIPPPALGATQSGNFLLMFWPVSAPGFVLESTFTLAPADWVPVPNPPIQIGSEYLESVQMTGTNQFYRLRFTAP